VSVPVATVNSIESTRRQQRWRGGGAEPGEEREMDLTTCAVCVLAGSAGGAVSGMCAGRRAGRRPGRRAASGPGRRTMRSWPGRRRRDADAFGGARDAEPDVGPPAGEGPPR
jgi:hypothetical protein